MASLAQRQAPQPTAGSQTQTEQPTRPRSPTQPQAILRLRGSHNTTDRSVRWRDDVVDNEGLGRKKSKVCCIYHRPRAVDESSDESSSDSSSSSDSDADNEGGAQRVRGHDSQGGSKKGKGKGKAHRCDDPSHRHGRGDDRGASRRLPSPNAYERVPKPKPKEQNPGSDGGGSASNSDKTRLSGRRK